MSAKFSLGDTVAAIDAGDAPPATDILTALLAETPDDPTLHYNFGIIAAAAGDDVHAKLHLNNAVQHAELVLRANPTSAAATLFALYLAADGRHADAFGFSNRASHGGAYDLMMSYGQLFTQLCQRENAITAHDAAAARRDAAVVENTAAPDAWVKKNTFSAANVSQRHGALLTQYASMHEVGRSDMLSGGHQDL